MDILWFTLKMIQTYLSYIKLIFQVSERIWTMNSSVFLFFLSIIAYYFALSFPSYTSLLNYWKWGIFHETYLAVPGAYKNTILRIMSFSANEWTIGSWLSPQVLRFFALWEHSDSVHKETRPVTIHYYLGDNSVEIRETHEQNSGRDPYPVLLRRQKVPKDVKPKMGEYHFMGSVLFLKWVWFIFLRKPHCLPISSVSWTWRHLFLAFNPFAQMPNLTTLTHFAGSLRLYNSRDEHHRDLKNGWNETGYLYHLQYQPNLAYFHNLDLKCCKYKIK